MIIPADWNDLAHPKNKEEVPQPPPALPEPKVPDVRDVRDIGELPPILQDPDLSTQV